MLLHKVTLEEFGAYRGEQSLNLLTKKNRPIILIGGLNGCGKTTLLDAIQLALYGPRARCSGRGNRSYETYLRESINRQADPTRGARVALEFTVPVEGQTHYYKVVRSWHTSGKSVREFLNVYIDADYGARQPASGRRRPPEVRHSSVLSESWPDYIEDLLPLEVASLFFFDGEKIESLADPERAASVIESAVHSLLGVNIVEQLRADLLALQRRQRLSDEHEEALAGVQKLERELASANELVTATEQQRAESRQRLDQAVRERNAADEAFRKAGGSLYERRAQLESERDRVAEELRSAREALIGLAAGALPLLMLRDKLDDLAAQAEREKAARQASQVLGVLEQRDQWVLELLSQSVKKSTQASLEESLRFNRAQWSEAAVLPVDLALPTNFSAQLAVVDQSLGTESERARELLLTAARANDRLTQLDRQLAGVPAESKIEVLQRSQEEKRAAVAVATAAIKEIEERLNEVKRTRDAAAAALARVHQERVKTLVKAEEVKRILAYSEKARGTLERFGDALLKRHISRLEVAVLQSFNKLMRKQGLVRDLRIDVDKFTLTLSNDEGDNIDPNQLSAGERQLLAVSLLWGLVKVAGNRLPNVIDTPLGRLDSRHRQHLVDRYFPHASHQVLLLSTDEEIDEHLMSRLSKSIAHTYTLVHDDRTFTTTVEQGYWWGNGGGYVA